MAMTEEEIFSSFAKILNEVGGISAKEVTLEADLTDDLGVSSLDMVEIITSAEDEFSIEIPDEALKDLRTVKDVVGYVRRMA